LNEKLQRNAGRPEESSLNAAADNLALGGKQGSEIQHFLILTRQ